MKTLAAFLFAACHMSESHSMPVMGSQLSRRGHRGDNAAEHAAAKTTTVASFERKRPARHRSRRICRASV